MQVAHHNDHITHTVIGGKQSIEFGISSSAEFFNILSSTLYKDQILAVVREVLCNAWDAHIEAGCTDRPVQVTLVDGMFTIKDFGKGIHQDDMGLIYGTYGNSTKKNDGNQTGGFGLGCKAPFAYTDHFEVVSCHDGVRTIYTLSKSSAQAMGKPGITPIASFPCSDSGLTVSIRHQAKDHQRFKELITRIAYNGDMNVTLNGERLTTLGFDTDKGNWLLTQTNPLDIHHPVMIRYGNVIYPVEMSSKDVAYIGILNHLNKLNTTHHHYSIVFQAPAHSISVTPSREHLSMQDHTINTLHKLFEGFRNSLNTTFKVACDKYVEEVTNQAVTDKRVDELLKREAVLPVLGNIKKPTTLFDFDSMAKTYMGHNYPSTLAFRKADVTRRLQAMVESKLLDRGKVQTFLRELNGVRENCGPKIYWRKKIERTDWLQRRVIAPLLSRLSKAGLATNKLFSCNSEDLNWEFNHREGVPPLVVAKQVSPRHLLTTLPYLRNIVVITTRRQNLESRAYEHEIFKTTGQYEGYLVYVSGRKKGELEAVRQFFAKEGMCVVDLTLVDEQEKVVQTRVMQVRKPPKKGIAKLSVILNRDHFDLREMIDAEEDGLIENPEFVLQMSLRNSTPEVHPWRRTHIIQLIRLFGDKGGVTNNTATYNKWLGKGAVSFMDYVEDKICEYIMHNPRIETCWGYRIDALGRATPQSSLLHAIHSNQTLSKEFGLVNPLTEMDKTYLDLWAPLSRTYSVFSGDPKIAKLLEWFAAIPTAPSLIHLNKKLSSHLISYLDIGQICRVISRGEPKELTQLVTFVKTTFNL